MNINYSCSNHHTYNFLETHSDIAATARYPAGFAVSASSNTNNIKTISRPSYLKTIFNFLFACIQSRHPATIARASRERKWQVAIFLYFMRRKLFCEHSGLCSWNKPSWLWLLSCSVFKAQRGECLFKSFTAHFQNALASLWRWWYKINNLFRSHAAIIFLSPNPQNDLHCLLVIPEATHIDIFVQHFAGSINHVWIIDKPCWGNNDPSSIEQNNDLYCSDSWFHRERENKREWEGWKWKTRFSIMGYWEQCSFEFEGEMKRECQIKQIKSHWQRVFKLG